MTLRTAVSLLGFLWGTTGLAQAPVAPVEPAVLPAPQTKPTPTTPGVQPPKGKVRPKNPAPAWLFPDWALEGFSWRAAPVLGFRFTMDEGGALTQVEGGLAAGLRGIPVASGNPGITLAPHAGYAMGYALRKPNVGDVVRGPYHRGWGGVEVPLTVKFFKHTLGLDYGNIWGEVVTRSHELALTSDSAVLVLPFFSAHYTYTRAALFGASLDEKVNLVHDNWWHLRFFTPFLSAYLDFGPGYEIPYLFMRENGKSLTHHSSSTYFLSRMGAELLPRFLEANGQFRYTLENRSDDMAAPSVRRPSSDLNAAPTQLGQPADSLLGSLFVGWKGAIWGLGFGYRYSIEVTNLSDAQKRETRTTQGVGLHGSQRF